MVGKNRSRLPLGDILLLSSFLLGGCLSPGSPGCGDGTNERGELCYAPPVTSLVGESPLSVAVGDLDGDLDLDIVTANTTPAPNGPNTVSVLLNEGSGQFSTPVSFLVGEEPNSVLLSDLDGDLDLDIVALNGASEDLSVLLNLGGAQFTLQAPFPVGPGSLGLSGGDFDGDSRLRPRLCLFSR